MRLIYLLLAGFTVFQALPGAAAARAVRSLGWRWAARHAAGLAPGATLAL